MSEETKNDSKSTEAEAEKKPKKKVTKKAVAKKSTTKKTTTKKTAAKKPRAKKPTGKSLVIVESPGKIKTISKFLGKDFIVKASFGHVRDLPGKELGVDLEDNFKPKYVTLRDKSKVIKALKQEAKKCDKLYLAPDPDREGEAIAFHLKETLKFAPEDTFRVTFTEITKKGIAEGFANAHKLNDNLVNAQQARRILDRIVGYKLSPLLWKKVAKGLSGGRVQSVAVRVVCEREDEINKFIKEEYWKIAINVSLTQESENFEAQMITWDNKDFEAHDEETVNGIVGQLENQPYLVTNIEKKGQTNRPSPPFITSTLQQAASTQLRYSAKNTMRIAQQLYEGVDLKNEGSVSLITYMRTDSFNLSDEAKDSAKEYIVKNLSDKYYPETPNVFKSKKNAQEAHEAIRPTNCLITPDAIKDQVTPDQFKLYNLIWRRFIASQMAPSKVAITNAEITASKGIFKAQGRIVLFDGYLKIYSPSDDKDKKDKNQLLPEFDVDDQLILNELLPTQHFTQPPPRYTEASLVRLLEKEEIGRPATYATILSTIQDRGYVTLETRKFHASELGMLVNHKLVEFFPSILGLSFTAEMESNLDKIAEGEYEWPTVIGDFYKDFEKDLEKATEDMPSEKNKQEGDEVCELCQEPMVIRWSKKGKFLGCSGYPKCKNTKSLNPDEQDIGKELGVNCQKCDAPMILKISRRGKFAGCSSYPDCKTTLPLDKNGEVIQIDLSGQDCEKCGAEMVLRMGRRGPFISCSAFPACRNTKPLPKPEEKDEDSEDNKEEVATTATTEESTSE
ncbi:MAG: DNA topoisomerase I [Planctomycetota bacterium]|nr:MAG: DNA topoisomerase I [Planctomycetota bacterium]